jgi:hypothetical protein
MSYGPETNLLGQQTHVAQKERDLLLPQTRRCSLHILVLQS